MGVRSAKLSVFGAAWLLVLVAALAGCAAEDKGGSGGGGGDAADAGQDASSDGGGEVGLLPDVQADPAVDADHTEVAEEPAPPCGGQDEACCAGSTCDDGLACDGETCQPESACPAAPACLDPAAGTPDVPIEIGSGDPPALAGGEVHDGYFVLTRIELYDDYTFSDLVDSVAISSSGDTYGSLELRGADWGVSANLDLYIDIMALGTDFAQPYQQPLFAGGCYTIQGNALAGDLTECGSSWPAGSEPPDSLDYESTPTTMRFLLILTRDALLASVPPENAWAAQFAINEDLPVVLTFTRQP